MRVGLIGFGLAGRVFHGPLLEAEPGFDLAMIATGNPERQVDARRRHPSATVVASSQALLKHSGDLDVVVIASPPTTHVSLANAALDAGLAVVVDKPLCAHEADAARLVDHAQSVGQLLTVFQNRRWDSDFLTLRRVIESGELGEIRQFESRFERWNPGFHDSKPWRAAGPEEAGGIVYDLGSHLVDQAMQLFGPVADVHAEVTSHAGSAPDDAFLSLRHDGGVRSRLWMSAVCGQPEARFRVLGSEGAFTAWGLDIQEAQLAAGMRPGDPAFGVPSAESWPVVGIGDTARPVSPERGDYPAFYAGLVDALTTGSPVPVDPSDVVAVTGILELAHSSG